MEIGTRVRAECRLVKIRDGRKREWRKPPLAAMRPVEGIYIGWRIYHNGTVEYGYLDEPTTFSPREHMKVALIVTSARENPVPVLFDDMHPAA